MKRRSGGVAIEVRCAGSSPAGMPDLLADRQQQAVGVELHVIAG